MLSVWGILNEVRGCMWGMCMCGRESDAGYVSRWAGSYIPVRLDNEVYVCSSRFCFLGVLPRYVLVGGV